MNVCIGTGEVNINSVDEFLFINQMIFRFVNILSIIMKLIINMDISVIDDPNDDNLFQGAIESG